MSMKENEKPKQLEEDERVREEIREMLRIIEGEPLLRLKSYITGLAHIKKRP